MGSMKDQLGDNLPTIGDSRRQGMTTFSVHCGAPCGHVSKLTFDALRLPDEALFIDIPKRRRLRCSSCGRRATEISASWNEVVHLGNGLRPTRGWIVVIRMPEGTEGRSSPMPSEERAMGLALDLAEKGDEVLRIEGPAGDVRDHTRNQGSSSRQRRREAMANVTYFVAMPFDRNEEATSSLARPRIGRMPALWRPLPGRWPRLRPAPWPSLARRSCDRQDCELRQAARMHSVEKTV